MKPKSRRRVHGAELKAQVMAQCEQPGASVAAVAMAHGLNVNLVRKWLIGRGLKRTGLAAPRATKSTPLREVDPTRAAPLSFLPIELTAANARKEAQRCVASARPPASEPAIEVELRHAGTELSVRWPASQAAECVAWLCELASSLR